MDGDEQGRRRRGPSEAKCPIRPGEPCTLCHIGAHGPQDCPLVYLVMDDPELREELARSRRAEREGHQPDEAARRSGK